jgi:hypothetical protein
MARVIGIILVVVMIGITTKIIGVINKPDLATETIKAKNALNEATAMMNAATKETGYSPDIEVRLFSTKNMFGAADGKRLYFDLYALIDDPVESETLEKIKQIWITEFGYTIDRVESITTILKKGERTASISNNASEFGGSGRTSFSVSTEYLLPDAARSVYESR